MGRSLTRAVAALVLVALVATGCGGDDDDAEVAATDSTTTSATTEAASSTEPEPVTRTLGKVGWWARFEVTVDDVEATPGIGSVDLVINVTWENLDGKAATPPQPSIVDDGEVVSLTSDATEVAGSAKAEGTLSASVEAGEPGEAPTAEEIEEALDRLDLVFGEAADNQTIIPLDEDTEPETVEPEEVPSLAGDLTAPAVKVTVDDGRIEPSYQPGDKGDMLLSFHLSMVCGPECPASGTATGEADFTLVTPEGGSPLSPSDQSTFCCHAVYANNPLDDAFARIGFEIPEGSSGTFTLQYTAHPGDEPVGLEFTL